MTAPGSREKPVISRGDSPLHRTPDCVAMRVVLSGLRNKASRSRHPVDRGSSGSGRLPA
ncbi:MAG: hypothetical protein ACYCRD_10865 [Leptospirillum sp.]